jgi:hypothetical protein
MGKLSSNDAAWERVVFTFELLNIINDVTPGGGNGRFPGVYIGIYPGWIGTPKGVGTLAGSNTTAAPPFIRLPAAGVYVMFQFVSCSSKTFGL